MAPSRTNPYDSYPLVSGPGASTHKISAKNQLAYLAYMPSFSTRCFEKPAVFRARCEAYFEHLHYEADGKTLRKQPMAQTIARLALFVGFNHVQTFHDQADRGGEFADVVRWCRIKIRAYHEERVASSHDGSFAWLRHNAAGDVARPGQVGSARLIWQASRLIQTSSAIASN